MLALGLVMPVAVESFCGGFRVVVFWLEGWRLFGRWLLGCGRFFDNYIQKKEKRGRQGPAELRKEFNRYFGGHVSREDVTCV
jgi:hypothetical protein